MINSDATSSRTIRSRNSPMRVRARRDRSCVLRSREEKPGLVAPSAVGACSSGLRSPHLITNATIRFMLTMPKNSQTLSFSADESEPALTTIKLSTAETGISRKQVETPMSATLDAARLLSGLMRCLVFGLRVRSSAAGRVSPFISLCTNVAGLISGRKPLTTQAALRYRKASTVTGVVTFSLLVITLAGVSHRTAIGKRTTTNVVYNRYKSNEPLQ